MAYVYDYGRDARDAFNIFLQGMKTRRDQDNESAKLDEVRKAREAKAMQDQSDREAEDYFKLGASRDTIKVGEDLMRQGFSPDEPGAAPDNVFAMKAYQGLSKRMAGRGEGAPRKPPEIEVAETVYKELTDLRKDGAQLTPEQEAQRSAAFRRISRYAGIKPEQPTAAPRGRIGAAWDALMGRQPAPANPRPGLIIE